MDDKKITEIYNNERICVIRFLDKFLSNIKKNKMLNNLDIVILGDHGSKNSAGGDDLSTLLIQRNNTTKYLSLNKKITIQEYFKRFQNKKGNKINNE